MCDCKKRTVHSDPVFTQFCFGLYLPIKLYCSLRIPWVRVYRYSEVHNHNSTGDSRLPHNSIYTYRPSNYCGIDFEPIYLIEKIYLKYGFIYKEGEKKTT